MMVDKIQKNLNKFSQKEKNIIKNLLIKIKKNQLANLDIRKLKGKDNIYRARKGKIRIIYKMHNNRIYLITIEKRTDKTYRNI